MSSPSANEPGDQLDTHLSGLIVGDRVGFSEMSKYLKSSKAEKAAISRERPVTRSAAASSVRQQSAPARKSSTSGTPEHIDSREYGMDIDDDVPLEKLERLTAQSGTTQKGLEELTSQFTELKSAFQKSSLSHNHLSEQVVKMQSELSRVSTLIQESIKGSDVSVREGVKPSAVRTAKEILSDADGSGNKNPENETESPPHKRQELSFTSSTVATGKPLRKRPI